MLIFWKQNKEIIIHLSSSAEDSQRVVMGKDKPCLTPKVIKRFEEHYGFKHQN